MTDTYQMLLQRRADISAEIKALDSKGLALKAEDQELETAQRVLERFMPAANTPVGNDPVDDAIGEAIDAASGKPDGTPTTPNMIIMLLKEAERQGKPGLEPKEMHIQVCRRWWPSAKSEDIGPTAWRMRKDGRLTKQGSLYMLPKNTEAADLLRGEASAASDAQPEAKGREAGPGGGP